ncbi:HesB/YadR/YfhF family protein [Virgibacillus sp. W0181]|uniref:HesB/YadR/YfhF family protein n=1 Tax=Virgibacillus sp. W0181 TaxID=3391581 RepID=UPI003F47B316
MKINVTDQAAKWYKNELSINSSKYLRFFVRYGGYGGLVPGFSLGVEMEKPNEIHTSTTVEDIIFYIEEADAWYFDGKNLTITMDETYEEPKLSYQ